MTSKKVPAQMQKTCPARTKIVCTLGPASADERTLRAMIDAGMNVARINLSHGRHVNHAKHIDLVRRLGQEMGRVVAIMADLQGPKVRIGKIENEPMTLEEGSEFTFTSLPDATGNNVIPLPQPGMIRGVHVGGVVWLNDGLLELMVVNKAHDEMCCQVVVGGPLYSNQGISAPGVRVDIPSITSKDRQDLEFAVARNVDYVAMSFVRSADDIRELRHLMNALGASIPIVAKIEHPEALDNLDCIVKISDAVMVARGDLGVEAIFEEVPAHQRRIIRTCNQAARPVITATQILDSMIHSSHPTRAEANDVFTSIIQGSDALMLSGETAIGEHPVRAVKTMARIARMAERYFPHKTWSVELGDYSITEGIGEAACSLAANVRAEAIITNTILGRTTRKIAKHRPQSRIISTTPEKKTHKHVALVWGVESLLVPKFQYTDEMIAGVKCAAVGAGLFKPGDTVVITGGVHDAQSGQTNLLQVHRIKDEDAL
jgi:pyruvate kinase